MGSTQEVTIDTAAGTGDQTTGGVKVNYVPRDGGNNPAVDLCDGRELVVPGRQHVAGAGGPGAAAAELVEADLRCQPDRRRPHRAGQALVLQRHALPGEPELRGRHLRQQERRERERVDLRAGSEQPGPVCDRAAEREHADHVAGERRNKITGFFEKQWRTWDDGAANRSPESFTRTGSRGTRLRSSAGRRR